MVQRSCVGLLVNIVPFSTLTGVRDHRDAGARQLKNIYPRHRTKSVRMNETAHILAPEQTDLFALYDHFRFDE